MRSQLSQRFAALQTRNFRLYFAANSVSVAGTWMQRVSQAWLVLELTSSGTLLGVTAALQHLPTLVIGPWGGLMADRYGKRRILLITQVLAGSIALTLAWLTITGRVTYTTVLWLALSLGTVDAFARPTRQIFVLEMVGRDLLTNAVVLNSVVINTGMIVGPAAAGIVVAAVGTGPTFLLNGLSYLFVIGALLALRTAELVTVVPQAAGRRQLTRGLLHVMRTPSLRGPMFLIALAGMFALEWTVSLPLFVASAFDAGPESFGLLFSTVGVGAVLGGLLIGTVLESSREVLLRSAVAFSGLLILAAGSRSLWVAGLVLFAAGAASVCFKAVAQSLVQLSCEPEMRGRVMALFAIAMVGLRPVGGPVLGMVGDRFGGRAVLLLGAGACLLAVPVVTRLIWKESR